MSLVTFVLVESVDVQVKLYILVYFINKKHTQTNLIFEHFIFFFYHQQETSHIFVFGKQIVLGN